MRLKITMKIMLRELLEKQNISQNQLAKETGISTATLRNISHNRTTRISFDVVEKLCSYLNCGIEDLFRLETASAE